VAPATTGINANIADRVVQRTRRTLEFGIVLRGRARSGTIAGPRQIDPYLLNHEQLAHAVAGLCLLAIRHCCRHRLIGSRADKLAPHGRPTDPRRSPLRGQTSTRSPPPPGYVCCDGMALFVCGLPVVFLHHPTCDLPRPVGMTRAKSAKISVRLIGGFSHVREFLLFGLRWAPLPSACCRRDLTLSRLHWRSS